jgi:hypothetical protein
MTPEGNGDRLTFKALHGLTIKGESHLSPFFKLPQNGVLIDPHGSPTDYGTDLRPVFMRFLETASRNPMLSTISF